MMMDWRGLNRNKMKIWLEAGLALLLVIVIGVAGHNGAFSKKDAKANKAKSAKQETLDKAEKENEAAKSGKDAGGASESDGKDAKETETEDKGTKNKTEGEDTEEVIAEGQYPIMGKSSVTVEQMVEYFKSSQEKYPSEALSKGGADSIESFCQMYYDEATAEGIRPEVPFVQTMKETGWLQYGGDASIEQFNFAGLGTTGGGVAGNSYPDVRTGIRAQIQHLKAYATADALAQECVDERYEYVTKGSAPYVEWLGQQENPEGYGWATADNYGYSIVDMISKLKQLGD